MINIMHIINKSNIAHDANTYTSTTGTLERFEDQQLEPRVDATHALLIAATRGHCSPSTNTSEKHMIRSKTSEITYYKGAQSATESDVPHPLSPQHLHTTHINIACVFNSFCL